MEPADEESVSVAGILAALSKTNETTFHRAVPFVRHNLIQPNQT
jgi:hypothetical protein